MESTYSVTLKSKRLSKRLRETLAGGWRHADADKCRVLRTHFFKFSPQDGDGIPARRVLGTIVLVCRYMIGTSFLLFGDFINTA